MLAAATGYDAVSFAAERRGSQGEYAGLLMIAWHASRGRHWPRRVRLIPASAHGTNPASAQMAGHGGGRRGVRRRGNVDLADLEREGGQSAAAAAIMVTVSVDARRVRGGIARVCEIVHAPADRCTSTART